MKTSAVAKNEAPAPKSETVDRGRRAFLTAGAVAGGGLLIGFSLPALALPRAKANPKARAKADSEPPFAPNAWIRIGSDDHVLLMLSQVEMGQGVMTAMPMLLAEELDADWNKIQTEWAPVDPAYGNPMRGGAMATVGSQSVRAYWKPLREAGAAARAMLVTAAAQTWGVPETSCSTEKNEVIHSASGRRLRYGALTDKAAQLPVPTQVSMKDLKSFRILGHPLARLDIPLKVNGTATYGIDVKVPNMLIARVLRCPVFGGAVSAFNATAAKAVPGVRNVVQISSGIAVVADSFYAANQGLKALEVKWDEGPYATLSTDEIRKRFAEAAEKPGIVARNDGDAARVIPGAAKRLEAVYDVPYLAHATMEPQNCTADVRKDGCDVWAPTQSQTSAHLAAIKITGLPPSAVKIHPTFLGGGFGRRGEADFVADAVETSKAIGGPVKVVWTREDDIQHDFYRPLTHVRFWAALDGSGTPLAYMQRMVQPSLAVRFNPKALDPTGGVDANALNGALGLPYSIPNIRIEYIEQEPGIPIGFWRSVGSSVNGYVVESFIDEMAAAAGKDPYEFRRGLLDKAPRNRAVLELAAQKAGWGQPLPPGRARGISVLQAFDTITAEVAEVSVSPEGRVRVHRIVCAVDCGWTINPDTIQAQLESGIVYGLTAALKGEITIQNGRVTQSNFDNYQMMRMNEMPRIEVHIVPSSEAPGGIGEPSTPPVFSALVNAIFAATGKRIRRLPIRPGDLKTA